MRSTIVRGWCVVPCNERPAAAAVAWTFMAVPEIRRPKSSRGDAYDSPIFFLRIQSAEIEQSFGVAAANLITTVGGQGIDARENALHVADRERVVRAVQHAIGTDALDEELDRRLVVDDRVVPEPFQVCRGRRLIL